MGVRFRCFHSVVPEPLPPERLTAQRTGLMSQENQVTKLRFNTSLLGGCLLVFSALQAPQSSAAVSAGVTVDPQLQALVQELKEAPRGPFQRLRWFCNDGAVLPPKPYACSERGGGRQHGQYRKDVAQLRSDGFAIANVLASIDADDLLDSPDDTLQQLLIEKFFIRYDDGWIFHRARFYRGGLQVEDEIASAQRIVEALLTKPEWRDERLLLVYDAARALPWVPDQDNAGIDKIRADAARLNDKDAGFASLRNKIHGSPDAQDAERVRSYAAKSGKSSLQDDYAALAQAIDKVNDSGRFTRQLSGIAGQFDDAGLAAALKEVIDLIPPGGDALDFLQMASGFSVKVRNELAQLSVEDRMQAVAAVSLLEQRVFVDLQGIQSSMATESRQSLISVLFGLARAAYGTGLLSDREWQQFEQTHEQLKSDELPLGEYRQHLQGMARVPTWVQRRFVFDYAPAIDKLAHLEPLAAEFIPNQMRAGPLLMYSQVLAFLSEDATQLAGVQHELFGKASGSGLRGLNPGFAKGILLTLEDYAADTEPDIPKILLVPETLADLPPVAGIITENEGNQLSHVQLLARNLGIPNVVVAPSLLDQIRAQSGQPVSLASSSGGVIRLNTIDAETFREQFRTSTPDANTQIVVDVDKLKLDNTSPVSGTVLRSADSGVRVGPKAAKLGELNYRYPGRVSPSLAIPFGSFRRLLDQNFAAQGDTSAFEWLKTRYTEQAKIDDAQARHQYRNDTLAQIRHWILSVDLDPAFVSELKQAMANEFGADGSYGVFVRSDTNVEDLPGFTGAGLNLTVPNVVGFDNIVQAIRRVWASPFTERAFGWRQALMDRPEHLYVAVLLHQGVNSDKSGVLVTAHVETGDRSAYTVVANEGVGGGVEGQSAEMVVVFPQDATQEFHGSATAPTKRIILAAGGSRLVRAKGPDRLLNDKDIAALDELVADLEGWFVENGQPIVADVEFGFLNDELVLFQIRPFVENDAARGNSILQSLDEPLKNSLNSVIELSKPVGI